MSPGALDVAAASSLKSLLVVRLSAMGDIVHAIPAVTALRTALPNIKLGWIVEERWAELLCTKRYPRSGPRSPQRPIVDQVHTVDTKLWRRSMLSRKTWQQVAASRSELRSSHYDAVIDFQGAIRSAFLSRWAGASLIFGSARPREGAASFFYSRKIFLNNQSHVINQAFEIALSIVPGMPGEAIAQLPTDPISEAKIDSLIAPFGKFVILNPGAGWGAKRWPAERYGEVAKELARSSSLTTLINYGPGEDQLAATVESASDGTARKINCSISELISLTRRAQLFVGGDTGPMHLAAALGIPVVAIFGPTNPARNGPFATNSIVLRSPSSVTDHSRHREPEQGLLEISVEEVVAAARKLVGSDHE